jgi:hypothetical protein
MTNRTVLSAVLAAVLAVPAAAGLAGTPCDLLPTTNRLEVSPEKIGGTLCNACVGPPVPGFRDGNGNGLDYNDGAKHWECEIHVGNRGNGVCKSQTVCLPLGQRFDDNGVFRCRYPAVFSTSPGPSNPRDNCERGLRVSISAVKNLDGTPLTNNVIRKPGPVKLLLEGDGAANGVSATIGGGISAIVGDAAGRLGSTPRATCLPPNCQVVYLDGLANAPTGRQTLTLKTPHGHASASVDLIIDAAPVPVVLGDVECEQPAKKPANNPWVEIRLSSSNVGPGLTIPSNQVFVNLPAPVATPGKPAPAQMWKLTLHQSDLQSVSPTTFTAPGPVTFSFTTRPRPPAAPPPPPQGGGKTWIAPIQGQPLPSFRRCVWAQLESSFGTTIVAAPVHVTP